jgi:hypothetical protein
MRGRTRRAAAGLALLFVVGCSPQAPAATGSPSGAPPSPSGSPSAPPSDAPEPAPTTDTASWEVMTVAPMLRARDGFRVLPLGDETVLVVGDDGGCHPGPAEPGSETSERYDPIADEWTVAASLNKPRKEFAMVPAESGGVMVLGGINDLDQPFSSTKRFDLDSATWVDGPLLGLAYAQPSAVTLADGSIYVIGVTSQDETTSTSTMEFLPAGGAQWVAGWSLPDVAVRQAIALDGTGLLVVGSSFESEDQVWVTSAEGPGTWEQLVSPGLATIERIVADGAGLLAFGTRYDAASGDAMPVSPLRWDPVAGEWIETGPMATPRTGAAIVTLADGRVMAIGGVVGGREPGAGAVVRTSEVFDPVAQTWSAGPEMTQLRYGGQAVVLDDGSVLVMGGQDVLNEFGDTPFCPGTLTTVERIVPTPWAAPEV